MNTRVWSETGRSPVGFRWWRGMPALTQVPGGLWVLLMMLALALAMALSMGAVSLPLLEALLLDRVLTPVQQMVLLDLRLPRVVLAGLVGTSLAISGAAMQGLFRNPLAEPQLIGVSSGAALGAIAMIVFGNVLSLPESLQPFAVSLAAIAGAFLVTAGLYVLARRQGTGNVATMLLLGIAVNAIAGVGIGVFTWFANDGQLRELTFWTMGSFGGAQWLVVLPTALLVLAALLMLLPMGHDLDRLQLGELEARRLGVSVDTLKRKLVFAVAVGVGASVAVAGVIGFVGLVVPHIARMLVGVHHRVLLVASALLGAVLTVMADLGARTLAVPAELPVGLLTSAMGAPFFLWLIVRVRHR